MAKVCVQLKRSCPIASANVGAMTMLRYTFTGAAITGLIVTAITGFDAPVLTIPIHWQPFLILMFVLIFPTTVSYLLIPIGLKYLKTTVVAIYGYLILIVATITSLAIGQAVGKGTYIGSAQTRSRLYFRFER